MNKKYKARARVRRKPKRGYEGGGLLTVGLHLLGIMLSGISDDDKNVLDNTTVDIDFELIEPKKLEDGKEKRG